MNSSIHRHRQLAALIVVTLALSGCTTTGRGLADMPPMPHGAALVYAVADIADCRFDPPVRAAANRTAALVPAGATVLAPGDLAYHRADAATLERCFAPTWGRHREKMLIAAGNHDYVDGDTRAVREYFPQASLSISGDFLAYATQLTPDWWLVVLDSNVAGERMRRQVEWLDLTLQQLRASPESASACLAVMWHAPVYSSGLHRGSGEHMRSLWAQVDRHGADLVLSGHEHFYERFGPLDAEGNAPPDAQAPRQFVVGTGGAVLYGFWRPPYRSESRVLEYGVLQLALGTGEYRWQFIDVDGRTRDAGAATCRRGMKSGNVPPTAAATPADR